MGILSLTLLSVGVSHAVTQEEMEQARTIAAKTYLRWANDGSGYLDEISPKTMAQLEQSLKAKEKENIVAFKAIKTPTDYASWDKEALVKYWSETFFSQPGLTEKGKAARNIVKRKVSAMTVTAPSKQSEPATKPAEETPGAADVTKPVQEDAKAADAGNAGHDNVAAALAEDAADVAVEAAAVDSAEIVAEQADSRRNSGTSVWIYILVLCVLVGVVIWLVIFASKTMKNAEEFSEVKGKEDSKEVSGEEDAPLRRERLEVSGDSSAQEQLLSRKVAALSEENARLSEEVERLKVELATARRSLAERHVEVVSPATATPAGTVAAATAAEEVPRRRRQAAAREIFLGRVNAKGLFVRADRTMTPGKSVYRLTTTDGLTGSYRVVTDEEMVDTILDNPAEYLIGGCVAKDMDDTDGMVEIVTESAGTAIFEDGCWRVLRKAKISYR